MLNKKISSAYFFFFLLTLPSVSDHKPFHSLLKKKKKKLPQMNHFMLPKKNFFIKWDRFECLELKEIKYDISQSQ